MTNIFLFLLTFSLSHAHTFFSLSRAPSLSFLTPSHLPSLSHTFFPPFLSLSLALLPSHSLSLPPSLSPSPSISHTHTHTAADSSYAGGKYRERSGQLYTRWGTTVCPDTADLIYHGVVASSHYALGGTDSYLCLINKPKFYGTKSLQQAERTWLYGTEFGTIDSPDPNFSTKDNVPCAVCDSYKTKNVMVVPGTYECPPYWTTEYTGYLMAGYYGDIGRRKETICIDKNPEKVPGTSSVDTASLLFFTESTCTGIKCAPYSLGAELACAVCTK